MTDLAGLLELLYLARTRWRTARLTVADWTHLDRQQDAYEHGLAAAGVRAGPSPAHDWGAIAATTTTWAEAGGRFRQERVQHGACTMTLVSDGRRTWIETPESGVVEHESETIRPAGDELLDPSALLAGFDLAPAGETEVAGRRALAVEARPRDRRGGPADLFPSGCDELLLAVDAELGVVLRFEARFRGEPVRLLEVEAATFDEPLADELFAPPAGQEIRTAAEAYPTHVVTLEQAARAVPFRLWAPKGLAGRWHVHVVHRPGTSRPRVPESVLLLLHDAESLHHFGIEQAAERLLAWRTGQAEVVERDGLELRLIGGDRLPGPPLEVHLEREGTFVRVWSDNLDADALVEVAAALAPAPTDPPALFEADA